MIEIEDALKKLYSLHQFNIKLGLESITSLLEFIGNPHKKLNAFHIAGSNGKGSTASFIASILQESGFRVGLYTSPHIERFNERIRINGITISDEYISKFVERVNHFIEEKKATFFEITTALAFQYFNDEDVDYCVIETGLGGRLDATNVLDPIASIITTISLEHTNILGDSIEKIAYEKGGIIKPTKPVFVGLLEENAIVEIKKICAKNKSEMFQVSETLEVNKDYSRLSLPAYDYTIYSTPLKGDYQRANCALAILAVNFLVQQATSKNITNGILNVLQNSGIMCRYEVYNDYPKVIFDASHNVESISAFLREFEKEKGNYRKVTLIFGIMKDKNIDEIVTILKGKFDEYLVTSINSERAADAFILNEKFMNEGCNTKVVANPHKYILEHQIKGGDNCLVVLGSIYLLGEIKKMLINS
ncbi:MAG: bifunctional folylpolyglutamate synthase/dihydrofolate synthase [Melioribacteraceae bacterium]|nr:bifunctional folylpolyglutamate synthase/dihydrofolate synthase [Melioribacteraceae bacterium]